MPITVADVATLEDYLQGVMNRADHHAENVDEVVLALMGAALWRKDAKPLEVRQQLGEAANVIWFEVNGTRYALAYNHSTRMIELRARTIRGTVVESFDNQTTMAQVRNIFAAL